MVALCQRVSRRRVNQIAAETRVRRASKFVEQREASNSLAAAEPLYRLRQYHRVLKRAGRKRASAASASGSRFRLCFGFRPRLRPPLCFLLGLPLRRRFRCDAINLRCRGRRHLLGGRPVICWRGRVWRVFPRSNRAGHRCVRWRIRNHVGKVPRPMGADATGSGS